MVEKIAITDEHGAVTYVGYDELDSEFYPEFCKPTGAFTYSAANFMHLPLVDVPFYIDGWLPKMGKAEIYGTAKGGKSILAVQIARCIGLGEPFLGMTTAQGRVLYMQFELGPKILQNRMIKTGQSYENVFVGTSFSLMIDKEEGQKMLRHEIEAVEPNVLIVDPLYKCMSGDENEAADMKVICNFLDSLIEDYKLSILLLHHTGKDTTKGGRGSSVLEGWVDSYISLTKMQAPDKKIVMAKLMPRLMRHAPPWEEAMTIVLGDNFEFEQGEKAVPLAEKVGNFMAEMKEFRMQDVIDSGLASRKTAYDILARFQEVGCVKPGGERGLYEWVVL